MRPELAEAILLVGGEGTRLRPLTLSTPKPMLPVAGVPLTVHQIERARDAGVRRLVLGTAYRAEVFADNLGDGSRLGVEIAYAFESEPLGTGGAIRHAAEHLTCAPDDPVVILNGDILGGVDLEALVIGHRAADADVTLHLTRVEDPRRYGLVPTGPEGQVLSFLEKPTTPEEIVTDQINAGCYVFRRSVIDRIPAGRPVSVEREVFPALLGEGIRMRGVVDDAYWLDLGTPWDFARGSADLVRGIAPWPGHAPADSLVLAGATVDPGAMLTGGTTVGAGAVVACDALVDSSVLFDGARVDEGAVVRRSIIGRRAHIGPHCTVVDSVVGDGAVVEADNELASGARIWPNAHLAEGTLRFG